jgi:hypothetical protein
MNVKTNLAGIRDTAFVLFALDQLQTHLSTVRQAGNSTASFENTKI